MNPTRTMRSILAAVLVGAPACAKAHKYDTWEEDYNVQALLGAVKYDHFKFAIPDSATPAKADLSLLPQLGGAWTTLPRGDRLQCGLETSFLLGFQVDRLNYLSASTNGLHVSLSTHMWMFDLAGGVYANLYPDPGRKIRLYVGGGPLIMYADYREDRAFDDGSDDEVDHSTSFGIGGYVRTGFEFRIHERGMLGIGARGSWADIDFTDVGGRSELVGVAGFITYTAGF